jgi:hypothetical protein
MTVQCRYDHCRSRPGYPFPAEINNTGLALARRDLDVFRD